MLLLDGLDDVPGFVLRVRSREVGRIGRVSHSIGSGQRRMVVHDAVREAEDRRCRTVVDRERALRDLAVSVGKIRHSRVHGTPETIDALPVVAHKADVAFLRREQLDEALLHFVAVL